MEHPGENFWISVTLLCFFIDSIGPVQLTPGNSLYHFLQGHRPTSHVTVPEFIRWFHLECTRPSSCTSVSLGFSDQAYTQEAGGLGSQLFQHHPRFPLCHLAQEKKTSPSCPEMERACALPTPRSTGSALVSPRGSRYGGSARGAALGVPTLRHIELPKALKSPDPGLRAKSVTSRSLGSRLRRQHFKKFPMCCQV